MAKTVHKVGRRAYVNPLPGCPEAAQRIIIGENLGPIAEFYVESVNVKRTDFIQHLRAGDEAVVAHMGCFAMAAGKINARMADLDEARGDVHAKGCIILDSEGRRSNRDWPKVKQAVRAFLLVERNVKNGSAREYNFTDKQILRIVEVRQLKTYTNDTQRLARLKKDGIDCGRTYMVTTAPQIARERGLLE